MHLSPPLVTYHVAQSQCVGLGSWTAGQTNCSSSSDNGSFGISMLTSARLPEYLLINYIPAIVYINIPLML